MTVNNFDIQRILNTFWFGARWKIRSDLEAMGGFYYQNQNNFSPAACTGSQSLRRRHQMRGNQEPDYRSCSIGSRSSVSTSTPASCSAMSTAASPTASSRPRASAVPGTATVPERQHRVETQEYDPTVGIRIRF